MPFVLELTPTEEARLRAAALQEGVDPADLARRLLAERLPVAADSVPHSDPTLDLFAQWEMEDADMSPEEVAEENRLWEELKNNLNAERDRVGARRVF
jgi:hypothetical protein